MRHAPSSAPRVFLLITAQLPSPHAYRPSRLIISARHCPSSQPHDRIRPISDITTLLPHQLDPWNYPIHNIMEFSSPLAAMQPPPRPWGCGRDIPNSRPRHAPSKSYGGGNFNFRDLSMKKSNPDYFTLKTAPVRGSSPTASLAADLSQNFHIDQRYIQHSMDAQRNC